MKPNKNPNVSTTAVLLAIEPNTKAKLKVGSILEDCTTDAEFVLFNKNIDLSKFYDPKFPNSEYVKLQIVSIDNVNGVMYD